MRWPPAFCTVLPLRVLSGIRWRLEGFTKPAAIFLPFGPATQILIDLIKNFDGAPLEAPFAAPLPNA